jgi:arginine repressor
VAIDRAGWPEVAGTIAGDDALFLATTGQQGQSRVVGRLSKLIKEN